ncbi:transforming growth factor beta-1-induced transcript 1 protein isoform X5 [Buteo buteo]|uniref:transforming growth factor beta-1-induced transcript 1 protein isoform X5 n=1 Tax=Buteo buteo TaxID=30397 RepID=UPI003EB6F7B9
MGCLGVFEVPCGVLGGLRGAPWVWGAPQRSNGHLATNTRTSHRRPVVWDAPSRWSSRCSMGCLGVFEVPHRCGVPHRGPTDTPRPPQEHPTGAPLLGAHRRGGLQGAPWGAWGSSRCPVGVGRPTEVQRTPCDPHKNIPLAPRCMGCAIEVVFEVPCGVLGGLRSAPWVWGAPQRSNGHLATNTRTSHRRPVAWDEPSRWSSRCSMGCLGVFEVPHGCGVPHRGPTDTPRPPQEHPTGTPLRGMRHRGGLRGAPWGAWGSSRCPMGVGCPTEVQQTPRDPHKNIPLAPRCVGCAIEVVFEVLRGVLGGLRSALWGTWGSSRCPVGVGCPTEVQRTPRDPHKNIPLAPHCVGCAIEVVFEVLRGVLGGLRSAPWVWGAPRRSNGHPATPTRTFHG